MGGGGLCGGGGCAALGESALGAGAGCAARGGGGLVGGGGTTLGGSRIGAGAGLDGCGAGERCMVGTRAFGTATGEAAGTTALGGWLTAGAGAFVLLEVLVVTTGLHKQKFIGQKHFSSSLSRYLNIFSKWLNLPA